MSILDLNPDSKQVLVYVTFHIWHAEQMPWCHHLAGLSQTSCRISLHFSRIILLTHSIHSFVY